MQFRGYFLKSSFITEGELGNRNWGYKALFGIQKYEYPGGLKIEGAVQSQ